MKPTTKIFLYVLFALGALVLFLYLRFPSDMVKYVLSERIQRFDPKARLETNLISPTVPPGLKLKPLSLDYDGTPVIGLEYLKITPNLFYIFSSTKQYSYKGNIGSGKIKGRAESFMDGSREVVKLALTLNRVPLNNIDLLNQLKAYKPDGELDATINFDSTKGGGSADISMTISPFRVAFNPPLMGIEALNFNRLKTQMILNQRMLQFRNCDADGDQIEGKMTGSIIFREPIDESRITLSLTVKPQPSFIADHKNDMIGGLLANSSAQVRGVVFRISGTINNPRYVIR